MMFQFCLIVTELVEKLVTAVKSNLKVPFSIATTPRCREGHYSIPRISPLNP